MSDINLSINTLLICIDKTYATLPDKLRLHKGYIPHAIVVWLYCLQHWVCIRWRMKHGFKLSKAVKDLLGVIVEHRQSTRCY